MPMLPGVVCDLQLGRAQKGRELVDAVTKEGEMRLKRLRAVILTFSRIDSSTGPPCAAEDIC